MELERVGPMKFVREVVLELHLLGVSLWVGNRIDRKKYLCLRRVASDVVWSFFAPEGPFSGHVSKGM